MHFTVPWLAPSEAQRWRPSSTYIVADRSTGGVVFLNYPHLFAVIYDYPYELSSRPRPGNAPVI